MALRFEFLARFAVDVGELVSLGQAPLGERRVVNILGGTWQIARSDGVLDIDARYTVVHLLFAAASIWVGRRSMSARTR